MKSFNRKQLFVSIILVLSLISVCILASGTRPVNESEESFSVTADVIFSYPGGLYSHPLVVELSSDKADQILYTLDGSVPAPENAATLLYDAALGIPLECGSLEQIHTIRAVACVDNTLGPVCTGTYVMGENVKKRYENLILTISGSPEDLFSSERGIFVSENGNRLLKGKDSEREVYMSLFASDGTPLLSQNCGLRIYGANSRNKNQPSFRLYARSEYDEIKDFDYIFFDSQYSTENALISDYKRVIVRNSGDDNGYAYLRSELASQLSLNAGFPDAQSSTPVTVYINGEYYGAYWFVTSYDDWYFENKYGTYDGEMITLEGIIALIGEQENEDALTTQIREEYNRLHEQFAYSDLNDDRNWDMLNASIDVENFLQYVAIQNYFSNSDAFLNNFKTYRYYSPQDDYRANSVFDGRYRFLLYDLDETMLFGSGSDVTVYSNTERLGYDIFYNALFTNIIKRPEGRNCYIKYYLSLLNYYFSEEKALPVMNEMHDSHSKELEYLYNETELLVGNADTPENADYSHALNELAKIRDFLIYRPHYAYEDLSVAFHLDGSYELTVENANESAISIDYAQFSEATYSGKYFSEIPVTVSMTPKCGYQLDYWLVNGEHVEAQSFDITPDMIDNGLVTVQCICSPCTGDALYISCIKSNGSNDYVELTNYGQTQLDISNYFLSDGPQNWNSSSLPTLLLNPGDTTTIYCKNYSGIEAYGQPCVNFNLKAGETVNLYRSNGELLQSVLLPKLNKQNIYRLDPHTGIFWELPYTSDISAD